jgi:hypothetical protein
MAKDLICPSMIVKNEARSSPAFLRLDRTELSFGSVLTDRWRGDACVELSSFFCAPDHGLLTPSATNSPFRNCWFAYDHDLFAASSVMSRTMTARKRSFDNMAIDR